MKNFSIDQLRRMHELLCEMTGNEPTIRELGLLESALYSVEQTFMGEPLYETTVERGARLCFCLIKNHAFVDANKRIGVLAIGYADGFPRALANLPLTLLHGGRRYTVRVAGRICMDQAMVDLTDTPAAVGDTVEIFRDAAEVAKRLSTIPYEVLTALSARLVRKRKDAPR